MYHHCYLCLIACKIVFFVLNCLIYCLTIFFSDDCGIFVMKFIELWNPRVWLTEQFSKKDIPNIRIQYANKLYFSRFNRVNKDLVINFYGEVRFIAHFASSLFCSNVILHSNLCLLHP